MRQPRIFTHASVKSPKLSRRPLAISKASAPYGFMSRTINFNCLHNRFHTIVPCIIPHVGPVTRERQTGSICLNRASQKSCRAPLRGPEREISRSKVHHLHFRDVKTQHDGRLKCISRLHLRMRCVSGWNASPLKKKRQKSGYTVSSFPG